MTLPEFYPRAWDETSLGLGRAGLNVRCRLRLPGELTALLPPHRISASYPTTGLRKLFSLPYHSIPSQKPHLVMALIENEGPGSFGQISHERMHGKLLPWTYLTQPSNLLPIMVLTLIQLFVAVKLRWRGLWVLRAGLQIKTTMPKYFPKHKSQHIPMMKSLSWTQQKLIPLATTWNKH